jgi:GMP synthase-like glutamine amidotransferase
MKPIAIFRHTPTEGPGYLAEFLDERQLPWKLIAIDAGEAVPHSVEAYSGLVFMGGPMSVNDDLPWIAPVLALIREAVARDIPVLGHCLGGQLISKALGGTVSRNPVSGHARSPLPNPLPQAGEGANESLRELQIKEIGWGEVTVTDNDTARAWFGETRHFNAFHWHGETFSLPQGAVHLLSSAYCANQAYAIGKHLALQCHVEMTAAMIASWCEVGADEVVAASASPAVQSAREMQRQTTGNLPRMQEVARRLYARWVTGLCA